MESFPQSIQGDVGEGGDLSDYQLARDRKRREKKTIIRFAQANRIAYAFNIGDQLDEPSSFQEA